jgi:hypothetical protein
MKRNSGIGDWWISGLTAIASGTLVWLGHAPPAAAGSPVVLSITLVRTDERDLACASASTFESAQCEYDADRRPLATAHRARPFTTTDREIVLLSGVFEDPRVAAWLTQAARGNDDTRVTFDCRAVLVGRAGSVGVRWSADTMFDTIHDIVAGRVQSCWPAGG